MRDIGIVGGGISGLHLGIRLLDLGHSATIYHPQTADEIANGRILNSVVHQHDTVLREQAMGIDFWNESNCRVGLGHDHCLNIPGLDPIRFWGSFDGFGRGVDYRIMLPRLMQEFEKRGGTLVHATKSADDLPSLQSQHELVAIGVGKTAAGFAGMFDEVPELSRHDAPARVISCGFYNGIAANEPFGVTMSLSPVSGELIVLPMETYDGPTFALLFENIPGGPAAQLAERSYDDDPAGYLELVLGILKEFHPHTYERVDQSVVRSARRHGAAAGRHPAGRPAIVRDDRRWHTRHGDRRPARHHGSRHRRRRQPGVVWRVDVGRAHRRAHRSRSMRRSPMHYEARGAPLAPTATVGFNDLVLAPPEYLVGLLMQMASNRSMCDEFTQGFIDPGAPVVRHHQGCRNGASLRRITHAERSELDSHGAAGRRPGSPAALAWPRRRVFGETRGSG